MMKDRDLYCPSPNFVNSRFQVILKIREDTDGIIPLKDRIQRMVTGQITDQMGKPVTASPVSTVYSSWVRMFCQDLERSPVGEH